MRLLLPMPVVANTPTWLGRGPPRIPTGRSMVSSPERSGPPPPPPLPSPRTPGSAGGGGGALWGHALGLVEALGVDVAEGDDLGHLVEPLLEVAQGGGLPDLVHGHQPAGGALGPAGVRGLRPVGDVGDPEQVAPAPLGVVAGQQLAEGP